MKSRLSHWTWNPDDLQEIKSDINEAEDQYGNYDVKNQTSFPETKHVINQIKRKLDKKHPPEGSHIDEFNFGGDVKLTSMHDGKGSNILIPTHEYISKYIPNYKKDNPVGTHYGTYVSGGKKFVTYHGHEGKIHTNEVGDVSGVFSNTTGAGIQHKTPEPVKNPSSYPKGTYQNPHRNDGIGIFKGYTDSTTGKFEGSHEMGDYYDKKKSYEKNLENLRHFRKHHDTLDINDQEAVETYKESSAGINRKLRSMDGTYPNNRKKKIKNNELYKNLDKITSMHTVKDMHVYRGFQPYKSREKSERSLHLDKMVPGYTFKDHGYTGTSLNATVPRSHSGGEHVEIGDDGLRKTRRSVFKIHVPKGTRGHYFDHQPGPYNQEQEFVLHRGTTFKVTHHSMDDHTHFIHVKVVKQENHHPRGEKNLYKESLNFNDFLNLKEGKTIKDRSDHWNWSDKDVEEVKQKTKLIRKKKKEDRSHHWTWSEDDIEEVRPEGVTLHEISTNFGTYKNPEIHKDVPKTILHNKKVINPIEENLKHYKKHHDTLGQEELHSIYKYKKDSSDFNRPLRENSGKIPKHTWRHNHIVDLDKITSHPSLYDMHVYRGVSHKTANKLTDLSKFKPGYTFKDHGYTGTSLDKSMASNFSQRVHGHDKNMLSNYNVETDPNHKNSKLSVFAIHVPKGTRGHYIDHSKSQFSLEREFLLHRGTTFKVTHHSMDDKHHYIHVKVVKQDNHYKPKQKKLDEGKTIKDRSDHWNWSDKDVEEVKKKNKMIRKDRKEKRPDRSGHLSWSVDDIEEINPNEIIKEATLGSYLKPKNFSIKQKDGNVEKNLKHYKKYHKTLNKYEKSSITEYKDDSSDFNDPLRRNKGKIGKNHWRHDEIVDMDKVTSHPSLHDMHVYRGVSDKHQDKNGKKINTDLSKFKPGYTFKDHGYTGTSLSKRIASTFSNRVYGKNKSYSDMYDVERGHKQSLFVIHAPKGTRGHYIDHQNNFHKNEQEFTLHRGTTFKVTHHSMDDKHHYIHVKVVKQDNHHDPIASKKLNDNRKKEDDKWKKWSEETNGW